MTTTRPTKYEKAEANALRYRRGFGWLTNEEKTVLQRALETYIALGPNTSWPIKLARELLKGSKQ